MLSPLSDTSPPKNRSRGLPTSKMGDASSNVGSNYASSTIRKPFLTEEATGTRSRCESKLPRRWSDKHRFNPAYYKLAYISDEDVEPVGERGDYEEPNSRNGDVRHCWGPEGDVLVGTKKTSGGPERKCSPTQEPSVPSDGKEAPSSARSFLRKGSKKPSTVRAEWNKGKDIPVVVLEEHVEKQSERLEEVSAKISTDSAPSAPSDVPLTRSFLRKGSKKPSTVRAEWSKGKDIPRNSVVVLEELAKKQSERLEEVSEKTSTSSTKTKCAVAKDERSSRSKPRETRPAKTSEEVQDHGGPEESSGTTPPLPNGRFSKCPWRRDLEYASKGGACGWVRAYEEGVGRMRPFASQEAAEQEMRRALEELEGKSWKGKEEAMWVVVRLALHHPDTLQVESGRVVAGVCGEVHNCRQSVAGKAVLTAGCLYDAMGKKMENKLRAVVGALLTKSGNRTLSSYFRLVIKSLFRIVNATSPHKVALAFVHEGSRHPNKASRETSAQFLAVLTETMGPGNSLSEPLTSHMLKSAANFAFDCSPLTRYCGKRMLKVLMKHPNFEKLKDHHLDEGTAQNLFKVLESINTKGVDEELLPINIIK